MAKIQLINFVRCALAGIALFIPMQGISINNASIPQVRLTNQPSQWQVKASILNPAEVIVPPLPQTSGGPTPDGMACCINGMVWFDGTPVKGAEVIVQSAAGSIKVVTQVFSGTTSTEARPFYQTTLFESPLNVIAGETITLTARYSGYTKTIFYTALSHGQQVDITIPRPSPGVLGFANAVQGSTSTNGLFLHPSALATDSQGNVYVGGLSGARIWVYTASGQPIREWGAYGNLPNQFGRITSIAVDAQDHVYVADIDNLRVSKFTSNGTFLFAWRLDCAKCAQLGRTSIAVRTNGNVLVNTNVAGAGVLEEFDPDGKFLHSKANDNNVTSISIPGHPAVALDDVGDVYVADYRGGRVIKYTPDLNPITDQLWSSTSIPGALDVVYAPDGYVYVLRSFLSGVDDRMYVQRYTKVGSLIQTLRLSPPVTFSLGELWDMTYSAGQLLLADRTQNRILAVPVNFSDTSATQQWLAGSNAPSTLSNPRGMVVMGQDLYVTDCTLNTLTRFRNGVLQKAWTGAEIGFGANWCPFDLAHDTKGQFWAVDASSNQLQRFTISGDSVVLTQTWGGTGAALGQFNGPSGLGIGVSNGASDLIFVADTNNGRVQAVQIDAGNTMTPIAATGAGQFVSPWDVVADQNNNVFVIDHANHRLTKLTFTANAFSYVGQYGTLGSGTNQLNNPVALAIGPNGHVYIADAANSRVVEVEFSGTTGTQINVYGNNTGASLVAPGGLLNANGVAFDEQGSLFIAQSISFTPRIQKLSTLSHTAPIATIAALSNNAGALNANSVLTVTGIGQPSDLTRTILTYEWTITSAFRTEVKTFTTGAPELVLPASQLFLRGQSVSLRVQDSAGEWSPRATSDVRIYVSQFVPQPVTPTPDVTVTPPLHQECTDTNWLMMIYASADNPNDGVQLLARLQEVVDSLRGTANSCVRFAIQLDGPASITRAVGDTTRWIDIAGQGLTQVSVPEQEMDKSDTLHKFVRWAQDNIPARNYYLAIADHGQGMLGTGWDFTTDQPNLGPNDGAHYLSARDIASALSAKDIDPIHVLHLDSCSMGLLDVAYELRNATKILIASQYLGWATFGYDDYMQAIDKTTEKEQLAKEVVRRYASTLHNLNRPYTLAALDLTKIENIRLKLDDLAVLLADWSDKNNSGIETLSELRDRTQFYNSNADLINSGADVYVDTLDWAQNISLFFDNPITQRDIHMAASQLASSLAERDRFVLTTQRGDGALPFGVCLPGLDCMVHFQQAGGVSLYYPPEAVLPYTPTVSLQTASLTASVPTASAVFESYVTQQSFQLAQSSRWGAFLNSTLVRRVETAADQLSPLPPMPTRPRVLLPIVQR
jgi:sugar lactone lactonase YvrE